MGACGRGLRKIVLASSARVVSVQDNRCSEEGEDEATTASTEHCGDVKSCQFWTWYGCSVLCEYSVLRSRQL